MNQFVSLDLHFIISQGISIAFFDNQVQTHVLSCLLIENMDHLPPSG